MTNTHTIGYRVYARFTYYPVWEDDLFDTEEEAQARVDQLDETYPDNQHWYEPLQDPYTFADGTPDTEVDLELD